MTTRKALIIGNPGESGAENYCEGVLKDLENYRSFFTSPQGGAWQNGEITTLLRPTKADVINEVYALKSFSYSYVVFSGHGYIQQLSAYSSATMLELKKNEEINADELKKYATKRSIVLDCCREVYDIHGNKLALNSLALSERNFSKSLQLDPVQCRRCFDEKINQCSNGIVVQHSCSPSQTSGDDDLYGGYYISSVLDSAEEWVKVKINLTQSGYYNTYSVVESHLDAKPKTEKKAGAKGKNQTPYIEKPKSSPYFPFAIVVK